MKTISLSKNIIHPVLVLVGPTAVGKTSLSLQLAEMFNCEIISMDSMQVYRYMDIGTAKVSREEQDKVKHHLIDIRYPDEQYNASQFVQDALIAIEQIIQKGKIPLITGGTGLYLNSLVHGLFQEIDIKDTARQKVDFFFTQKGREAAYGKLKDIDPETAARIHQNDTQRLKRGLEIYEATGKTWSQHLKEQQQSKNEVQFQNLIGFGIRCERQLLYDRIADRAYQMMDMGLLAEVDKLLEMGYDEHLPSMQSIGYKQVVQFSKGAVNLEQAISDIILVTRRYAKRQFTWFNKTENITWYEKGDERTLLDTAEKEINDALNSTS